MNVRAFLGIVALVPAAFNIAPAAAAGGILVPICTGDGTVRNVTLPQPGEEIPGKEAPGCCAKGCHTGSRKKSQCCEIDTGQ